MTTLLESEGEGLGPEHVCDCEFCITKGVPVSPSRGAGEPSPIISEEELRAIREREQAASPGPWEDAGRWGNWATEIVFRDAGGQAHHLGRVRDVNSAQDPEKRGVIEVPWPEGKANVAFVIAVRSDIPRLLAEIDRLRASGEGGQRTEGEPLRDEGIELRSALQLLLDQVDYTRGACSLTEMVGAVLPKDVLDRCHAIALRSSQGGASQTP